MSGNKKKDPSAQRVAEAQEYAKAHPTEIHSHNLYGALSTTEDSMTWQAILTNGARIMIGVGTQFRAQPPHTRMISSRRRGARTRSVRTCPKIRRCFR